MYRFPDLPREPHRGRTRVGGANSEPTRLPSIQSPDICDYKVSPFSFVTPAALTLGNDGCEILLPSSLPIQQYRFYKVVVRRKETGPDVDVDAR